MAGPETSSGVCRCPSCGVRNRADAQWCTLCHAALPGTAPPAAAPPAEPDPQDGTSGPAAGQEQRPSAPGDRQAPDDRQAPGERAEAGPPAPPDPELVQQLILQLQAQEAGISLPGRLSGLGAVLGPGAPKGAAAGVAFGAALVVTLLIVAVLALVGLAL